MGLFSSSSKTTYSPTTTTTTTYAPTTTTVTSSNTTTNTTDARQTIVDAFKTQVNQPISIIGAGAESMAKGTGLDLSNFFTSPIDFNTGEKTIAAATKLTESQTQPTTSSNMTSVVKYALFGLVAIVALGLILKRR